MTYTPEEQAANRAKWVAALRSAEFEQGQAELRSDSGAYCCLGVACELAAREGVISPWSAGNGYEGEYMVPVTAVMDWLGLRDDCGETRKEHRAGAYSDGDPKMSGALTELNDSGEWTFGRIADLIDADGINLATDGPEAAE